MTDPWKLALQVSASHVRYLTFLWKMFTYFPYAATVYDCANSIAINRKHPVISQNTTFMRNDWLGQKLDLFPSTLPRFYIILGRKISSSFNFYQPECSLESSVWLSDRPKPLENSKENSNLLPSWRKYQGANILHKRHPSNLHWKKERPAYNIQSKHRMHVFLVANINTILKPYWTFSPRSSQTVFTAPCCCG